ncbi:hypothetical protein DFH28DRAFT_825886, partial [Melampsora americana]
RIQPIHWCLNCAGYAQESFWNVVDQQLEFLCNQTTQYQYVYVFFLLALKSDYNWIVGETTFEALQETCSFELPLEDTIQEVMDEMDWTHGEE